MNRNESESACWKYHRPLIPNFFCRKDNLQAHIRRVHPELSHGTSSAGGSAGKSGLGFSDQPDEEDEIRSTETPVKELEETEAKFFCQSPCDDEDKGPPITGKSSGLTSRNIFRSLLPRVFFKWHLARF